MEWMNVASVSPTVVIMRLGIVKCVLVAAVATTTTTAALLFVVGLEVFVFFFEQLRPSSLHLWKETKCTALDPM